MPGITVGAATTTYTGQAPDLILHSLAHFHDRGNFEAVFDKQNYDVVDNWFANERLEVQDGNSVEWRIMFDHNGSFRFVRLFETTPRNYKDLMQKGTAGWCYAECKAVYEARIMKQMRGKSALYNYLEAQYFAALQSAMEGIEESAFNVPTNESDDMIPRGVAYWINFLNSGTVDYTGGFNGRTTIFSDASTSVSQGGLSSTTYPKWRNWAGNHNGINMQTMDSIRRMAAFTKFKPPKNVAQYIKAKTQRYRIYTGITAQTEYERLVNSGPDGRNGDLNPFGGAGYLTFRGMDWVGLAALEGESYSPIYVLDMSKFRPVVHSDFWMAKTEPMNDQDNPHVFTVQWDFQYQFICTNKREAGGVLHTTF